MKNTSISLIAFVAVCGAFMAPMASIAADQVVSKTETTYQKQNERIMDGYVALDPIDNSVKTSQRTIPVAQAPAAAPAAAPCNATCTPYP